MNLRPTPLFAPMAWLLASAFWLSACGDDRRVMRDASIDRPADAMTDAGLSCDELVSLWSRLRTEVDRSCSVNTDCAMIGQPVEPTCNCDAVLACNEAANANAYGASALVPLEQELAERCGDSGTYGVCDCFPSTPQCEDGGCVAPYRACF